MLSLQGLRLRLAGGLRRLRAVVSQLRTPAEPATNRQQARPSGRPDRHSYPTFRVWVDLELETGPDTYLDGSEIGFLPDCIGTFATLEDAAAFIRTLPGWWDGPRKTSDFRIQNETCDASLGIHGCVLEADHKGPHACDEECDLGHLTEPELAAEQARDALTKIQRRCRCVWCGKPLAMDGEEFGPCQICRRWACGSSCWDHHLGKHVDNNETPA